MLLIITVDELKSEFAIFDKLLNEVVSNLYMFCSRMLNRNFRDVNGTGNVTIDGKMFLTNTIIKKEFFHPKKLGAIAIGSNVSSLSSRKRDGVLLLTHPGDKIITHITATPQSTFLSSTFPT